MRHITLIANIVLLMAMSFGIAQAEARVIGDYLEVRSTDVLVEPCFYSDNTSGKEATLIWHIRDGIYHGVSLAGFTAVAVVTAESNLAMDTSTRKSALYVDAAATSAQRKALENLVKKERHQLLGKVVSVKALPIKFNFNKKTEAYEVRVGRVLSLEMSTLTSDSHKPYAIWYVRYEPLELLKSNQVGAAAKYIYNDDVLSVRWIQPDKTPNAFNGKFEIRVDSVQMVKAP